MNLNIPSELYQALVEEANRQKLPVKTLIMRVVRQFADSTKQN